MVVIRSSVLFMQIVRLRAIVPRVKGMMFLLTEGDGHPDKWEERKKDTPSFKYTKIPFGYV